eukprot:CAMPEP_0194213982 /NCGR_PEP_ID=MMETSP0156-20130528/14951_1 /TAXON_ID=33649 /ORGANISM="Thalassionema nitzschioides, Strain L26-B" /LENGTH=342 /DNA_ID=CAMNT_0038942145 /DNA_START=283 /DNA_END=1311 /DNA_ORIENTATION=+
MSVMLQSATIVKLLTSPQPSNAGEIGSRITESVTTSDLGVSVRRSIVQGAQTMDKLDKQWELFSDKYGLGAERSKQGSRPKPKVIPPLLPLDVEVASQILDMCDEIFCQVAKVSPSILQKEIKEVQELVKPSFQRLGIEIGNRNGPVPLQSGPQFDFASYVRFRVYNSLLIKNKVDFQAFRKDFENKCGQRLLGLLKPSFLIEKDDKAEEVLSKSDRVIRQNLQDVQTLTRDLYDKGLVAASEISTIDSEQLADWIDDASDLQITLSLDGDITMQAQILLQEQGYNLIPTYTKFMIKQLLSQKLPNDQQVIIEEYYMDTDYNSDPDLYEVKEVLLNIVLPGR